MTETPPANPAEPAPDTASAGAMLRAAREAAGLSIDALSQQLKLAPRQVRALEDGDYASLPGRTFVRGFVRNYARAVGLDPDAVLAALPGAAEAPTLERSTIGATHGPMGELPASGQSRPGSRLRWLIALAVIAAIGAAALYEYLRPGDLKRGFETRTLPVRPAPADPVAPPAPHSGMPLPNPIVSGTAGDATRADGAPPAPAAAPAPVADAPPASPPATTAPPGPAAGGPIATPAAPPASPAANGEATLVITYRSSSWTEVKDRDGKVVLSVTGTPGATQTVTGKAPFDLTLGNAAENSVTWRGAPFDLAPHIRQNVARVRLP